MPAIPHFTLKPGYKPQAADTTAAVDALGFWLLRQRPVQQRLATGTALNQILWGQASRSEKQWRDVLAVLKTQGDSLDYAYLQTWVERLGILASLKQSRIEADV